MAAGNTYTPIATNTLSSDTLTVTFSSIPQTYTDLYLVVSSRADGAYNSSGIDTFAYYNSDQASNYSYTQIYGTGSTAGSNKGTSRNYAYVGVTSDTNSGNDWPMFTVDIMDYANSTTYKPALAKTIAPTGNVFSRVTVWRSTANISSITLYNELSLNFKAGSTFTLYGITAA